jgi:hypothetical protein
MGQKISRRAIVASVLPIAATAVLAGNGDNITDIANTLARLMAGRHGGVWRAIVDHETGFILIKPRPNRLPMRTLEVGDTAYRPDEADAGNGDRVVVVGEVR